MCRTIHKIALITNLTQSLTAIESKVDLTYSTSEVNTGKKWTDGKPIYRKCYSANNVSISSDTLIDATLKNSYVDKVIKADGYTLNQYGNYFPMNAGRSTGSSVESTIIVFNQSGLNLLVASATISGYTMIIEYTKA